MITAKNKTRLSAQKKNLPGWGKWLLAYGCTLALSAALVYFWRVSFSLGQLSQGLFTLYVALVFSILFLAFFCLRRWCAGRPCLQAALCVFGVGLLFCFATAPLQAPDETSHFLRAYSISMGRFNFDYLRGYPQDVNALVTVFGQSGLNHEVKYAGGQLAGAYFAQYSQLVASGAMPAEALQEPIMQTLVPFLPQALFMFFARLLGFGALGQMYAGRIAALLVYCLLCHRAFCNCDKYRGLFFAAALVPISLFMGASNSYDSLMLALCYLVLSYFCKREVKNRDIVVMGLALTLACYLKPNNLVLAFVLLLVPKERWKSKWKPWLVFGLFIVAGLGVYKAFEVIDGQWLAFNYPAKEDLPRGVGEGAWPEGQLLFVLQNPLPFMAFTVQTLIEEGALLFRLGIFGSMDMEIPLISGLSVMALCAAGALGIQQKEDTRPGGAWGLFLMALLYAASVLGAIYLLDSHYQSPRITGLQPRYFLPAFLLLFMLFSILLGKAVRPRLSAGPGGQGEKVEQLTLYIGLGVALLAAVLVFQSYFIGQWLPKGEGGWKMVNMFGWQIV